MKIYFALPVSAGRDGMVPFAGLLEALRGRGLQVLTEHLFDPGELVLEKARPRQEVFARDIRWLEGSDLLVAEVSQPSTGVGYEVAWALAKGKTVLCLARMGVPVSAMIEGNSRLTLLRYHSLEEAVAMVERYLEV